MSRPQLSPLAMASGHDSANRTCRIPSSTLDDPYALVDNDSDELSGLLCANGRDDRKQDSKWAGLEDFEGLPWWKIPSVFWLVGPFFLYTLAFGGSIVPKLNLIVDLICQKLFSDRLLEEPTYTFTPVVVGGENPQCKNPEVHKLVAQFTLILNVTVGVLSAITAPKLGAMSDQYGRKKLIVISSMGGIVSEMLTIVAAQYPSTVPYQILIVGCVFEGLGGSFTAGTVLSHSYTSDCTPPSKRGVSIGYLHACIFTGLAIGPLLAGYFVKVTESLVSVFYVTLVCHIFFILFILLVTPESLSTKKQLLAREMQFLAREKRSEEQASIQHSDWLSRLLGGSANPLAPLRALMPPGRENAAVRSNFVALALCDFVILGGAMATGTIVLLYSELTFGWSTFEASQFISLVSSVRVFVLLAVFPLVSWYFRVRPMEKARQKAVDADHQRALGRNGSSQDRNLVSDELPEHHKAALEPETNAGADMLDIWLIRTAIMSDMLGSLGYLLVRTPELFYASGAVTALGGIGSATIQASVTKHVPAQTVGQLLGAMGLLHAMARIITPVIYNSLYAATVKSFPQAFFVLLTALFGMALLASMFLQPHVFIPETLDELDSESESSPLLGGTTPTADTLADEGLLP